MAVFEKGDCDNPKIPLNAGGYVPAESLEKNQVLIVASGGFLGRLSLVPKVIHAQGSKNWTAFGLQEGNANSVGIREIHCTVQKILDVFPRASFTYQSHLSAMFYNCRNVISITFD